MTTNVVPKADFTSEWDQINSDLKKEFNFYTVKERYHFLGDKKFWFIFKDISYYDKTGTKNTSDNENATEATTIGPKIDIMPQKKKFVKLRFETIAKNLSKDQDIDLDTLNNVKLTNVISKFYLGPMTAKFNFLLRVNSMIEANFTHNSSLSNRLSLSYKFDSLSKNFMSLGFTKSYDTGKVCSKIGFENPTNYKLLAMTVKKRFDTIDRFNIENGR